MYLVENRSTCRQPQVSDPDKLAYVTQTTLSVDDAELIVRCAAQRFPDIVGPKRDDICYATQNRQDAVKFMAPRSDLVLVVGSPNSSNSNRLREVAEQFDVPAYLIDNAGQIDPAWLEGRKRDRRDGRRVGAGGAGGRSRGTAARAWRRIGAHA
jgi:4-hydroxy-3-methylbut-2-enyl diphosphate reductase